MNKVSETFFIFFAEFTFFWNEAQYSAGDFRSGFEALWEDVHDDFDVVVVLAEDGEDTVRIGARFSDEAEGDFFLEHEDHTAEGDMFIDKAEVDLRRDVIGEVRNEEWACVLIEAEVGEFCREGVILEEGDVCCISEDFFEEAGAVIIFFDEDVRFLESRDSDGEGASAGADFEDMGRVEAFDFASDGVSNIFVDEEVLPEAFFVVMLEGRSECARGPLSNTGHNDLIEARAMEKKRRPKRGALEEGGREDR